MVTLRGHLDGGYVPPDGVALRLLIDLPHRARPYEPLAFRTDAQGNFVIHWSWGTGSGVVSYPLAVATTATESDFPFTASQKPVDPRHLRTSHAPAAAAARTASADAAQAGHEGPSSQATGRNITASDERPDSGVSTARTGDAGGPTRAVKARPRPPGRWSPPPPTDMGESPVALPTPLSRRGEAARSPASARQHDGGEWPGPHVSESGAVNGLDARGWRDHRCCTCDFRQ